MKSIGSPLLWVIFAIIIIIMLAVDLLLQKKRGTTIMTLRQAAIWSILWVILSLLFNLFLWWHLSGTMGHIIAYKQATVFLTGYLIEKVLAIDNLFVWLMLFQSLSLPPNLQHRVLIFGIFGAIILRTMMIFFGSCLVTHFQWVLYIFGTLLIFTGLKIVFEKNNDLKNKEKTLVCWIRRQLRVNDSIKKENLSVNNKGTSLFSQLLPILIFVELSDIIFALDSIPAIFSITKDPFLVLTSNLFAILGLRAMYFLLVGIVKRFSMLKYGLSVIMIFIGCKMLCMNFYNIRTIISLSVVIGIIVLTLIINILINHKDGS
ncbi:TerC/Alx family metal homeostasis membrane protein [Candidatus Profftia sp. (ex Adelges kitamiensis)]|uniref:TerC/Alx family metal homeostasis membrane protein n=1 Tax=Candidatus Profftia sp. (ex Adelges kitamiensis) TaxID=2864218 RepID=UPI001CE2D780|nr:TerC/Alx family metal homeostasis membrane protein [Candidatus Profftia sp. (ex Adelges kitamiensis)]